MNPGRVFLPVNQSMIACRSSSFVGGANTRTPGEGLSEVGERAHAEKERLFDEDPT